MPTALERTCSTWLISMPIAACQLVLTTAVEDHVFVTDPNFAVTLPLAASGAATLPKTLQVVPWEPPGVPQECSGVLRRARVDAVEVKEGG